MLVSPFPKLSRKIRAIASELTDECLGQDGLSLEQHRAYDAATAVEVAQRQAEQEINYGVAQGEPIEEPLLNSLYEVMSIVASLPTIRWQRLHWYFLEQINGIAEQLSWWLEEPGRTISRPGICRLIEVAHSQCSRLRDPHPPDECVVDLEPLRLLLEQKVKPRQICCIYDWYDQQGQPDLEKYEQALAGQIQPPTKKVHPPRFDGPPKHPDLKQVKQCLQLLDNNSIVETQARK